MKKKFFLVAFALLCLCSLGSAQFYILDQHAIEISVDVEGNSQISERYFMRFQNEQQLLEFRQTVGEIGVSLAGWKEYDARIFPHIGQESEITVNGISFNERDMPQKFLEISYVLNAPIAEKRSETSRAIEYSLKTKFFNEFIEGDLWAIPQNTSITVKLPKGAEIEKPVKPDAKVEENIVVWQGYVFGNELEFKYRLFKQISSFDLGTALQEIMKSGLFWVIAGFLAVVSVIIFAKRKSISQRMENYVVEHSDFGIEEED